MRVAVIGARRRNQGTGAHLARFLLQAGADVCAVLGTSERTAAEASRALEESSGHRAAAHTDFEALVAACEPRALVIASPTSTHEAWLERALEHRLHVLCEKALVWGGDDPHRRAERLGGAFRDAGLCLRVNAQWPKTLPAYRALFPDTASRPATFWMRLSPMRGGPRMFRESLSHPLSLLAAVHADSAATITEPRASYDEQGGRIAFGYGTKGYRIQVEVELGLMPEPPRVAGYGFDGRIAMRHIEATDPYTLTLEGGGRRVPMPDPTPLLVGSFLEEAGSGGPYAIDPAVEPGMRQLVELMAAVPAEVSPAP